MREEAEDAERVRAKSDERHALELGRMESRTRAKVAEFQAALDTLAREKVHVVETLADREQTLSALRDELKTAERRVAELESTLKQAAQETERLRMVVEERDAALREQLESYNVLHADQALLINALQQMKETTASLEGARREAEEQRVAQVHAMEERAAALEKRLLEEGDSVAGMQAMLESTMQGAAGWREAFERAEKELAEREGELQELTASTRAAAEESLMKLQSMEQLHTESLAKEVARKEEAFTALTRVKNEMQYAKMDAEKAQREVQQQLREVEEVNAQLRQALSRLETQREAEKANADEALRQLAVKYTAGREEVSVLTAQRTALLATEKEAASLRTKAAELESTLRATNARMEEQEQLIEELEAALQAAADQEEALLLQVQELAERGAELAAEKAQHLLQVEALKKTLEDTATSYNDRIVVEERLRDRMEEYRQLAAARQLELRTAAAVWLQATESLRDGLRVAEAAAGSLKGPATPPLKLQPLEKAAAWYADVALRETAAEARRSSQDLSDDDSRRASTVQGGEGTHQEEVRVLFQRNAAGLCAEVGDQLRQLWELGRAAARREETLRRKLELEQQLRAALDTLAVENVDLKEAGRNYQSLFNETQAALQQITNDFQQQLLEEKEAASVEVVTARRDMQRAGESRRRAEQRAQLLQEELEQLQHVKGELEGQLLAMSEERDELRTRATETVEAVLAAEPAGAGSGDGSDLSVRASRYSTAMAQEQAQVLQVTSLQSDLLLVRRQLREMEAQDAALRRSAAASEREVAALRTERVRLQRELEREHVTTQRRYSQLLEQTDAGAAAEELRELRLKVRELEGVVFRFEERERELARVRSQQEVQAGRRQEAVLTRLRSMSSRMTDVRRQLNDGGERASRGGLTLATDPQLVAEVQQLQHDLENYEKLAVEHHLRLESLQAQLAAEREARAMADKAVRQLSRHNERLRTTMQSERQSTLLALSPFTPPPPLTGVGASPLPRTPLPPTPTPEEEEEEEEVARTPTQSRKVEDDGAPSGGRGRGSAAKAKAPAPEGGTPTQPRKSSKAGRATGSRKRMRSHSTSSS
ncbi:hypothetical protein STCU_10306 [Strigomonas culicis]|uniref:Uncharacterized protein n=1 Tax=Strigomonas culicis TaxID=28005 RepID=S9UTQ6_9TRYP|nr:hypothetical protein STCU_10306 [Strigomonas culicis]|eukprot:EPY17936.1 hypothetical protein STCU_10306 [Strigomonas culicis]